MPKHTTALPLFYVPIAMAAVALLLMAWLLPGTGDEGDSITHYLIAKYALVTPANFFDHWGKPLFVLFSTLFAQAGFVGIKVFNVCSTVAAMVLACLTAQRLGMERVWLLPFLLFFSPMYTVLTLSGLTEPFSAAVLMAGIYGIVAGRVAWGVVILSFLPFVRSEGLIILGVTSLYLLYIRGWRYLPLLLVGHVVYAVAGYAHYGTLWWVLSKIPYRTLSSEHYGSGDLLYFVDRFKFVSGYLVERLLVLGWLWAIWVCGRWLLRHRTEACAMSAAELLLVYGMFGCFFVAHTLFWYLGIFGSAGMLRVMVTVIPLVGLIALRGANVVLSVLPTRVQQVAQWLIVVAIALVPFSPLEGGWKYSHFDLKVDQRLQTELAQYVRQQYPNYQQYRYYYEAPFLSVPLNHNFNLNVHDEQAPFAAGTRQRIRAINTTDTLPKPTLVIWDDWYAVVEGGVKWDSIRTDPRLREIKAFEAPNEWGEKRRTVLFEMK